MRHLETALCATRRAVGKSIFGLLLFFVTALFAPGSVEPAVTEDAESRRLAGRLLVASERLGDPNFSQSVIFLLEHDARGAMGLVINRRLGAAPISELLQNLGMEGGEALVEIPLYFGGPVEPERGFLLHSDETLLDTSRPLRKGFALTSDPEMLAQIGQGKGPKAFRFLLGYAGWAPGQLEAEIASGAWLDIAADPELVFSEEETAIWARALAQRGLDL